MKMKCNILTTTLAALCILPAMAMPQDVGVSSNAGLVTIKSKGNDVRDVLFDLFAQSKKNFVLDPAVRFTLYLHLAEVSFDDALTLVLKTAELEFEVREEIYFIRRVKKPAIVNPNPPVKEAAPVPVRVTDADLQKKVTTRYSVTDIRQVFAEFGRQTGIKIEVSSAVPNYKVDAFLINTSLKYSLDVVTEAANLTWTRTDRKTILIDVKKKA